MKRNQLTLAVLAALAGLPAGTWAQDAGTPAPEAPQIANMTIQGNSGERGILLRRGTGADIYNTVVTGSASCIKVDGAVSIGLLGSDINIESAAFNCATVVDGGDATTQSYLDGAVNVIQKGEIPPAATLPADGFFEQTDVVGSDFDSWKGNWTFGQ